MKHQEHQAYLLWMDLRKRQGMEWRVAQNEWALKRKNKAQEEVFREVFSEVGELYDWLSTKIEWYDDRKTVRR
jgi:hypothetical protein